MPDNVLKWPLYARLSVLLVGALALIYLLYLAQAIIIPLMFAAIASLVLNPVVNFFVRRRWHRVVAISTTLFLAVLVFAAFGLLLYSQLSRFAETLPVLMDRFAEIIADSTTWLAGRADVKVSVISEWIAHTRTDIIDRNTQAIGHTLVNVGSGIMFVFLLPVYVFMMLYYSPLLMEFTHRLFSVSYHIRVGEIVVQIRLMIQQYLLGLLLETLLIATLYCTGLFVLGIEYALVLGIIGAVLNLIPYIGAIIAALLPMMVAIATKSSPWFALLVLAMYVLIQFVDNNYIVPKLVASKVKINALVTLVVVIAFGMLWGIAGMFLSIPLTAIIKLIFDRAETLKPWGYLLGDTLPGKQNINAPGLQS